MKALLVSLCLCSLLGGCAIGQDIYDDRQIEECRDLPTPNERVQCERDVRDAAEGFPLSLK